MSRFAALHLASRIAARSTPAARTTACTSTATRRALSSTPSTTSSSSGSSTDSYKSPYAEFFEMVKRDETPFGAPRYTPPSAVLECGVLEDHLEFQTNGYGRLRLAPHVQPLEHRVVLTVSLDSLPIKTLVEYVILKEIVGKRLNEEKRHLKLQSTLFGSRIENKRHVVSMLDRIILNTKRLAKEMEEEELERSKDA